MKRFVETESVKDHPKIGWPKTVTNAESVFNILIDIVANSKQSLLQIAPLLNSSTTRT